LRHADFLALQLFEKVFIIILAELILSVVLGSELLVQILCLCGTLVGSLEKSELKSGLTLSNLHLCSGILLLKLASDIGLLLIHQIIQLPLLILGLLLLNLLWHAIL
jgi:hypothetical protein